MSFFEQNLSRVINDAEQTAESVELSHTFSPELAKALTPESGEIEGGGVGKLISRLKESNPQFISSRLENVIGQLEQADGIPSDEIKYFMLSLLSKTKPSDQEEIINRYQEILFSNEVIREDLVKFANICYALEGSVPIFLAEAITFFRSLAPEEQQIYRPIFNSVLNQLNQPLIIQAALPKESRLSIDEMKGLINDSPYDAAQFFTLLPKEERKEYYQPILELFSTKYGVGRGMGTLHRFGFSLTKEDRQALNPIIENSFKEAKEYGYGSTHGFAALLTEEQRQQFGYSIDTSKPKDILFAFFSNLEPDELEMHFPELCEMTKNWLAMQDQSNGEEDLDNYCSNENIVQALTNLEPDLRKTYFEIYPAKKIFNGLAENGFYPSAINLYSLLDSEDAATCDESLAELVEHKLFISGEEITGNEPGGVLDYYRLIQGTQFRNASSMSQAAKIYSALNSEVGEIWTANQSIKNISHYLERGGSIIGLDLSANQKRSAVYSGFAELGIDPMPTLSWRLNADQRHELPVILNVLAQLSSDPSNSSANLHGLCLPYRPRGEEVHGFEKSVANWLRLIPIALSVSFFDEDMKEQIQNHFEQLKNLQLSYGLKAVPSEPTMAQLKDFAEVIKDFELSVTSKSARMLGIHELTPNELNKLLVDWNYDITTALTLATRFAAKYPEGSVLCSEFLEAEARGEYWQKYYDMTDPIVRAQMSPLFDQVEDKQKALVAYHKGTAFIDSAVRVEKMKGGRYEPTLELKNEIVHRLCDYGHLDQLSQISGLSELHDVELDTIKNFLISGLTDDKLLNIVQFKTIFADLDESLLGELIRIHQWLKDTGSAKKTPEELERSFKKMKQGLSPEWSNLTFITDDLGKYYLAKIMAEKNDVPGTERLHHNSLLIHTTHNIKSLMEIGHYPVNSGSCQDYMAPNLALVEHLPSYVFDPNIFAIVIREVKASAQIEELIGYDETSSIATVKTKDGVSKVPISRPISRSMIFMGRSKNDMKPTLFRAPIYSQPGEIDKSEAEGYLNKGLESFAAKMKEEAGASFELDEPIFIPKSRNPRGAYLDNKDTTYVNGA